MCGLVRCPTCRGYKHLQTDSFGVDVRIAAFDLIAAQARGATTYSCWTCRGKGVVTQQMSDSVVMSRMRHDLVVHKVLRKGF